MRCLKTKRACTAPAECTNQGCIVVRNATAPASEPWILPITADEFAAMARDAERWRYRQKLLKDGGQIWQTQGVFTLRDIKRDVIAMGTSEESAIDAAMAERNKQP